jgi:hypothetical protein
MVVLHILVHNLVMFVENFDPQIVDAGGGFEPKVCHGFREFPLLQTFF